MLLDPVADAVLLRVRDDGIGMNGSFPGGGMRGMRERAVAVGATLETRSGTGGGAEITMRIPVATAGGMTATGRRTIRILLADDHAVVRRGLRMVLETEPDMEVVCEADDGLQAVELAIREEVDLAVLDVTMPRMSGLQAAHELSRRVPSLRILMLSMHHNEQYFLEALRAGAGGYVLKSVADHDLIRACRAVMRGEPFMYPDSEQRMLGCALELAGDARHRASSPGASPRSWRSSPRATPRGRSPRCS